MNSGTEILQDRFPQEGRAQQEEEEAAVEGSEEAMEEAMGQCHAQDTPTQLLLRGTTTSTAETGNRRNMSRDSSGPPHAKEKEHTMKAEVVRAEMFVPPCHHRPRCPQSPPFRA